MDPEPRNKATYELTRGSVVGKYEIMRRLAVGGMAEIYLARVTGVAGFEKLVVLKRILPNVAEDPTFVQMFVDEARLAATLRHPNIADVYDVGEDGGTYFFTMEYVHGQDVRAIRRDSRKRAEQIPLAISLAIVHGTASALDHAHEKLGPDGKTLNLVHRDVSSSNIMVSYDGAVKLLDFGIARAASSTHKTQTGTLKGKVPYMSPEQCKGLPLDRRSDLFSLGTVLYELTVGRRPFRGDTDFQVMDQIVYKGAIPPSQMVQGYPPELEAIVMKLLERGPSKRYPTGEDLLHDLDEYIAKHHLWMSPRAIGKYMRTLFADKIEAWEQAEQEGVPFAQHVAHTITSQSQRSELLTPPSALMGLPPGSPSQERLVAEAPLASLSEPLPVFQPVYPVLDSTLMPAARISEPLDTPPPVYPALPPTRRSGRTILVAFAGALVLGVGGAIGYVVSQGARPASVAAEKQEPAKQMSVVPEAAAASDTKPATKPATAEAKPTTAETKPPVDTKPVDTKPVDTKPATAPSKPADVTPVEARADAKPVPTIPVVDTRPTVPAVETKPKPAVETKPKPALETTPKPAVETTPKPAAETKPKPAAETKPKPAAKPKPAPKRPEPKPVVKPKPKPKPPDSNDKEQTWDPNSPFLPQ